MPLTISYAIIRMPDQWFARDRGAVKLFPFEQGGKWHEQALMIRSWKEWLPDGGAWLRGGFSKKRLHEKSFDYYEQFVRETRRGEWAHWSMLIAMPAFAIWNTGWSILILFLYALMANLPCIALQRYNRVRFLRLMSRRGEICYAKEMTLVSMEE